MCIRDREERHHYGPVDHPDGESPHLGLRHFVPLLRNILSVKYNDYVLNDSQSELEEIDTEDISEERNEVTQSKVWGLPIRVVHWAIVVAFFLPFVMEDDALLMHEGFGYAAGALVVVRILYGIAGP